MKLFQTKSPSPAGRQDFPPDPRTRLISLLLALVTVLVYLPVWFHGYIFFYDPSYVSDNPVVQNGITWTGLKRAFVGWHAGNWHPLTWLLELDRFDEALREYQEAAQLAPADPQPFYLIGKAWLRRGQSNEAVAAFQEALQLDLDNFQSLTFLARVLASDENPQIRDGTRAVVLAKKANVLTGGTQPFVLGTLAWHMRKLDVLLTRAKPPKPRSILRPQVTMKIFPICRRNFDSTNPTSLFAKNSPTRNRRHSLNYDF